MPFVFAICCGLFLGLKPALAAEKFVCAGFHSSETGAGFSVKITGSQPRSLPAQGQLSVLTIFAQFANEAPSGSGPPAYGMDLFDPDRPGSFSHF